MFQAQSKIKVNGVGQECPTHTLAKATPNGVGQGLLTHTVLARASGSLLVFEPGLGGRGFGGCTLVFLSSFLANVKRGRRILLARLGRRCLAACLHFGLRCLLSA